MPEPTKFVGVGVYTVPEAARLTAVSAGRIRRWMRGYSFQTVDGKSFSAPVWMSDLEEIDSKMALSFRDLIEVRFVDYFLEKGVRWKTLREAARYASSVVKDSHPFSTKKFRTDGRNIFLEFAEPRGDKKLLDLIRHQFNIHKFVAPSLYEGLDFDREVRRWFPMKSSKRIVIDPSVSFGQPTTNPEGVPTAILARAVLAEGSVAAAASWYDVDPKTVQQAVEFENKLAA